MNRRQKTAIMIAFDVAWLPLIFYISLCLRTGVWYQPDWTTVILALLVSGSCIVALGFTGLYRSVIRFLDLKIIVKAAIALCLVLIVDYLLLRAVGGVAGFPRTALGIFFALSLCYIAVARALARSFLMGRHTRSDDDPAMTVVYGAGRAGVQLVQAMLHSREYDPLFFVDDDPNLQGKIVAGLQVKSPDYLEDHRHRLQIDLMVIALPSATAERRGEILIRLEKLSVPTQVLPGLRELVGGQATLAALREVELPDLLGREPVAPRPDLFARDIHGKVVLVTGAGGSIGSELCRQVASQNPTRLVLLDHSEFLLYSIEQELLRTFPGLPLVPVLGSVVDEALVYRTMVAQKVETTYHAAAYKHVPMVEFNVLQGIRNNVFGSLAVASAAARAGVKSCVLISTDKAVRPTNVMGATKRFAEQVFQAQAASGTGTCFSMVRFGNVLGSSGSVVPVFRRQISEGGPITLTHQDINRFFMLIPEASQLVIQAGAMATGGEVFVLDMGQPIKIIDLARRMINLSGRTEKTAENPDGDIEIRIVGLRPGEKLYEELLLGENVSPSDHPRIMRAQEAFLDWAQLRGMLDEMAKAIAADQVDRALELLKAAVPEYHAVVV